MKTSTLRRLALSLTLLLVLAGCGNGQETATQEEPGAPTPDDGDPGPDQDDDSDDGDDATDDDIAPGPGFDGEVIRVGILTDASGPAASNAVPATDGQMTYFDYVNEELGGIAGRYRIEPVIVDMRYDLPTTIQQYNSMKDDVVMIGQLVGTPIVAAMHPELESDGIVAVPSGVDLKHKDMAYIAPYGTPYQLQAANLVDWFLEENGEDATVCRLIWADSDFGDAAVAGSDHAAEVHGVEYPVTATFAPADTDFTTQITQLRNGGCEGVIFTGLPTHSGAVLGAAAQAGYEATWLSAGPGWHYTLADSPLIDEFEARFFQTAEGPEWGDTSHPAMAAMIQRKERYAPDALEGLYFAYGYAGGMAVVQLLEKAVELGDLSHEGIFNALNSIDTATFDGLFDDYGWGPPADRDVPRAVTIFGIDREKPFGLAAVATQYQGESADTYPID
jgi:ABC-type branched-subunit amino acid transport system substrate-binding protein